MNKEINSDSLSVRKDILKDSRKPPGGEYDDLAFKKLTESWSQAGGNPASPALFKQRQSNFDHKPEQQKGYQKKNAHEIDSQVARSNVPGPRRQPVETIGSTKSQISKDGITKETISVKEAAKESNFEGVGNSAEDEINVLSGKTRGLVGFWKNQNDEVKNVKKKIISAIEVENDLETPNSPSETPQKTPRTSLINKNPETCQTNITSPSTKPNNNSLNAIKPTPLTSPTNKPVANLSSPVKFNPTDNIQTNQKDSVPPLKGAHVFGSKIQTNQTVNQKDQLVPRAGDISIKDSNPTSARISSANGNKIQTNESEIQHDLDLVKSNSVIVLAENEPEVQDPNIARCQGQQSDEIANEVSSLQPGKTQNLLKLFKEVECDQLGPKPSTSKFKNQKPTWILEIEEARGGPGWTGQDENTDDVFQPKPWENDLLKNKPKNIPKHENLEGSSQKASTENSNSNYDHSSQNAQLPYCKNKYTKDKNIEKDTFNSLNKTMTNQPQQNTKLIKYNDDAKIAHKSQTLNELKPRGNSSSHPQTDAHLTDDSLKPNLNVRKSPSPQSDRTIGTFTIRPADISSRTELCYDRRQKDFGKLADDKDYMFGQKPFNSYSVDQSNNKPGFSDSTVNSPNIEPNNSNFENSFGPIVSGRLSDDTKACNNFTVNSSAVRDPTTLLEPKITTSVGPVAKINDDLNDVSGVRSIYDEPFKINDNLSTKENTDLYREHTYVNQMPSVSPNINSSDVNCDKATNVKENHQVPQYVLLDQQIYDGGIDNNRFTHVTGKIDVPKVEHDNKIETDFNNTQSRNDLIDEIFSEIYDLAKLDDLQESLSNNDANKLEKYFDKSNKNKVPLAELDIEENIYDEPCSLVGHKNFDQGFLNSRELNSVNDGLVEKPAYLAQDYNFTTEPVQSHERFLSLSVPERNSYSVETMSVNSKNSNMSNKSKDSNNKCIMM